MEIIIIERQRQNHNIVLALLIFCSLSFAEIGAGFSSGTGVRALGFANNNVAAVNDLSAVYWNPAALALLPVREFQLSFDALNIFGESDITGPGVYIPAGAKTDDGIARIRMSSAGWMTAIPTSQGGLSIAFSFDRPFVFDDITTYTYRDSWGANYTSKGRRHGDLNRWSGAFGVQVTEQIAAGATISLITGKEEYTALQEITYNGEYDHYYKPDLSYSYLGYTITGGIMYYPMEILRIGMRVNAAMNISVRESGEEYGLYWDENDKPERLRRRVDNDGRAYVAPTGTLAAAVSLPWLTAALDLRATMPYTLILPSEDIPDGVQAKYYKLGGGIGLEVPLPSAPVVFRGGYSLDEYDLFPIIHNFDDGFDDIYDDEPYEPYDKFNWEFGKQFSVDGFKHTLTAGAGVFSSGMGFELSYAYETWGIIHKRSDRTLAQRYNNHRVAVALIYRY